jgi:5-methylcytosine-specific restriction endonuclease McrA
MRDAYGNCRSCGREKKAKERAAWTPEDRQAVNAKNAPKKLAYALKRLADPEQKVTIRAREAELSRAPHRLLAKAVADAKRYARATVEESEARRARTRKRTADIYAAPGGEEHRQKDLAKLKAWALDNPGKALASARKRVMRRRRAMPKWVDQVMLEQMAAVYETASRLNQNSDEFFEVDHIVPLCGKTVCGLHVPWNLQLLTRDDNRRKANRIPEYAHSGAQA